MKPFFKQQLSIIWIVIAVLVLSLNAGKSVGKSAQTQNAPDNLPTELRTQQHIIYEDQKLAGIDGTFGSVAIQGEIAVVGAPWEDYRGAVYIYALSGDTWIQQTRLTASDGEFYDGFGASVALDGDTVMIGAFQDDSAKGSVYVFNRTNEIWSEQAKLIASDRDVADEFGWSVALEGDTAIISALQDDGARGSAYVFTRTDGIWSQQAKLIAADGETSDLFGVQVSLSEDTVLIGASQDDDLTGAAYVFTRSDGNWSQQAKLTTIDKTVQDHFGASVALDGDTAMIGAYQNENWKGSAYIFVRSSDLWLQQAKLMPDDAQPGDFAGWSVALNGDTALIGSLEAYNGETGSAYVFTRSNGFWVQQSKLIASDGESGDQFSYYVALSDDTALVGAPAENDRQGAVYIYADTPNPTTQLLVNGNFEVDADGDYVPDAWRRKDSVGDGIRCNKPDQPPVAFIGQCAYLFPAETTANNRLVQNVDLQKFDLKAGDKIKLTGYYNKQSTGSVYAWVYVNYADLPQDNVRVVMTRKTDGYHYIYPIAITLKAKPTRVRVVIQNDTTSGKTWFDGMSLKWTSGTGILPLPQPVQ